MNNRRILRAAVAALVFGLVIALGVQAYQHGAAVRMLRSQADLARRETSEAERTRAEALSAAAALKRENLSLRDRISGWERRATPPGSVRVITDTIIRSETDTVMVVNTITSGGILVRLASDSSRRGLAPPAEYVGDCDLGLRFTAGRLECRRPRLGHFRIGAGVGVSASAEQASPDARLFVEWRPAYRSPWEARVEIRLDGRATLSVERSMPVLSF